MQGDEVGLREQRVQRLGALDAQLAEALGGNVGVVCAHPHLEAAGAAGDLLADPAEADQPEGLVGELHAGEARALPAALLQRAVRLRDLAREREQEPDRVLGGRDDRGLGCVGDDDAALGRRGEVDVVHAHSRAADHLQPVGALDQVGGELRRAADDDRVVVADPGGQVAVGVDVDVESLVAGGRFPPPRSAPG